MIAYGELYLMVIMNSVRFLISENLPLGPGMIPQNLLQNLLQNFIKIKRDLEKASKTQTSQEGWRVPLLLE